MATHSSTLAWKIPWTEEPGRLQSMGSLRVGHDWATSLSLFTFMHWRRKWQPTPVFLPGESQGRGSLVGSHRVRHDWCDLAAAWYFCCTIFVFFCFLEFLSWVGISSLTPIIKYSPTFCFWCLFFYISELTYTWWYDIGIYFWISSVQFSCSVVSVSLQPHEVQHTRPPCPSPTPRVHSDSRASSRWCHSAISSSVVPFSSCPQSLPASESFPMNQLFAWGGQSIGLSALASVLPKNTQDWSPSEWTGWISLQSQGLTRVFSNTTVQKHQFFSTQLSSQSNSI